MDVPSYEFSFRKQCVFLGFEHYSIWKVVQYYCRNSSSMWSGEYCRLSQMIMMMVFRVVLKNAILSSNPWSLEMDCVCASSLSIHKSAWKKKKKEKKRLWKKILGTINGAKPITHSIFLFLNKSVRRLEIMSGDDSLVQIVAAVWNYGKLINLSNLSLFTVVPVGQ